MNQHVVTLMMGHLGYGLDVVEDGTVAIETLDSGRQVRSDPDGLSMPEMDGFEATRRIGQLDSLVARTPIVALTANAFPADRQRCLDAGMDDYLAKPITFDLFSKMVRKWLNEPEVRDRR